MSEVPYAEIVDLARALVRTPSQSREDDQTPVLNVVSGWAERERLGFHWLPREARGPVGGYFHLASKAPGPSLCLAACLDTAPVGDLGSWHASPWSANVVGDELFGRGAGDSKVAASIFCHLFCSLSRAGAAAGNLYLLLDADEHTGHFGGIKAFLERVTRVDTVFVGYPGMDAIMIGARGFLRAEVTFRGVAAHSGSSKNVGCNAVLMGARFVASLAETPLPAEPDPMFPYGPKITVTALHGGNGFSQVPDVAAVNVDVRLTPAFDAEAARAWLSSEIERTGAPAVVTFRESWPPYLLPRDNAAVCALKTEGEAVLGGSLALRASGPSNIGNLLATRGIAAICGFGVRARNVHGANESVELASISPVFTIYERTLRALRR
jgi:succinyl-diaminopimelate desuccinylase